MSLERIEVHPLSVFAEQGLDAAMSSMMTPSKLKGTAFNKPRDWQAFERLICDLMAAAFDAPNAELHGRSGQAQAGVDLFLRSKRHGLIGVQCKYVGDGQKPLSQALFTAEVEKARSHAPALDQFILVTTSAADAALQQLARRLTAENQETSSFAVYIHGWEWVEGLLQTHSNIAIDYGLIATLPALAEDHSAAREVGDRLTRLLDLINQTRASEDAIGATEVAEAVGMDDWRPFEAAMSGGGAATLEVLRRWAKGLGASPTWLIHGKGAPFQLEEVGPFDASDQLKAILALRPKQVVIVRCAAAPFTALIAVQLTTLQWRVFDTHPAGPEVGATGRQQIFEFCCLLRELFTAYFPTQTSLSGRHISASDFQSLIDGELYPGVLDRDRHNDDWWLNLAEFGADEVVGDAPASNALRAAIDIALGVLEGYQDRAPDEAWRRDRLQAAGLPLARSPSRSRLHTDLQKAVQQAPRQRSQGWPTVQALGLERAAFSFTAAHDGAITEGVCEIDVANRTRTPLEACRIQVLAVEQGGRSSAIDRVLEASWRDGGEAGFQLSPGQSRRLYLCTRDLKDLIKQPAWQLRLQGSSWPMEDGARYILRLELRSNYAVATQVRLALDIDYGRAVSVEILEQRI